MLTVDTFYEFTQLDGAALLAARAIGWDAEPATEMGMIYASSYPAGRGAE